MSPEFVTLANTFIASCGWPVLGLIIVWFFRRPIENILQGIKSGKLGPVEFEAEQHQREEAGTLPGAASTPKNQIASNKPATWFWFTSDLGSAIGAIQAGADVRVVFDLINRSLNHALELNLSEPVIAALRDAKASVKSYFDRRLAYEVYRQQLVTELSRVFNTAAQEAREYQEKNGGFKADPDPG